MKLALALTLLAVPTVVAVARPAHAPQEPTLADLAWMAGHWELEADGRRSEEAWLAPGGGLMVGMNREVRGKSEASFEYLRIEQRKDAVVYVASPGGKGTTEFTLADVGKGFAQFENPAHDFPQRIRYELTKTGDLKARISAGEGAEEQAMEWTWKRAAAPAAKR